MDTNRSRRGAGVHVCNPHLLDNRSTSSSVCKAGALVSPSSCLDGEPHGWVPVDTHSTPVLTSVRRLWVAYVVQEPNTPQEHAQPAQGIILKSMFNDISCGFRCNKKECLANAKLVSRYAQRFGKGQWSLIGPGSEKSGTLSVKTVPQRVWDKIAERMLGGCPIFRATSPFSRCQLKSKGHQKLSIHLPIWKRLILFFRIIVSVNQISFFTAQ